jgi:exonuclease SbcD
MALVCVLGDQHFSSSYNIGHTDPTTQLSSRLLDFAATFDSIIDMCSSRGVKVVVLSGDSFNQRKPGPDTLNAFSTCIKRATSKGIEIVMISGNHDLTRGTNTTTLDVFHRLDIEHISVFTDFGVKSFGDFHLVLLPYRDRKMLNANTNEEASSIIRTKIEELTKDLVGTKIVVGHMMFEGTMGTSDSENFSLNEIVLPLSTFACVDAVVFGHVHTPAIIQRTKPLIAYVGSMEKITFGDRDQQKSTIVIDTNNLTKFEVVPTKTRQLFELAFDYADELLKDKITDRVLEDIAQYTKETDLKDAIVRIALKVKDLDTYHINQDRIRECVMNHKVDALVGITVTSTTSRQLRDEAINESADSKKAFAAFLKNSAEPETMRKKMLKAAESIIDEADGK